MVDAFIAASYAELVSKYPLAGGAAMADRARAASGPIDEVDPEELAG